MRFRSEAFKQCRRKARLANARFAGQEHHLAFPGLYLRPAPQQQFEFFFPSDKFGQASCVEGIKSALDRGWSQHRPGSHSTCDTFEFLITKVLKLEQVTHEPASGLRNGHTVRLCDTLQACRHVWRLANNGLHLRSTRADQIANDHHSRCDANTRVQRCLRLQTTYYSNQL